MASGFRRHLSFGGLVHPEVGGLIAATILTSFVAAIATRNGVPLFDWLALVPGRVLTGELWRLLTGVFVETGPLSLLFACLMFYWFGRDLADVWGAKRFVSVYLMTALAANGATCVVAIFWPEVRDIPFMGNWPVTEAMVIAWAAIFPDRVIQLYFIIPIRGRVLVYITVGTVLAMAAYFGLPPFLPHLFAQLFMLMFLGILVPRRLYLRVEESLRRLRRKQRVRSSHLKSVGRKPRD